MKTKPAMIRAARCAIILGALYQSVSCGRSEAASKPVDSLVVVSRRADSLAVALRQREDDEKRRVADSIAAERVRPRVLALFDGESRTIPPQAFEQEGIYLPSRGKCVLTGRVEATLGGVKDVYAYVFTDDEFVNWRNGGTASALFHSGPKTITNIDLPLPDSGKYRLVVSNRHSYFTAKAIRGDVSVRCIGSPVPMSAQ